MKVFDHFVVIYSSAKTSAGGGDFANFASFDQQVPAPASFGGSSECI